MNLSASRAKDEGQLQKALDALAKHGISKRRNMSWASFLVELLRVASTLEHKLMAQYLFGAYTLGGRQVPAEHRDSVKEWQEALLTVAREEMGHLLTVLNMLTFLRSDINFGDEFPWNIEYLCFEPVSLNSLACYVYIEMNDLDEFPEKREIEKRACAHLRVTRKELMPVEELYSAIILLLSDEDKIPESALNHDSYLAQASWDDWGRGYGIEPRPLDPEGSLDGSAPLMIPNRAILLINNAASRTEAIEALKAVSIQGEGPVLKLRKRRRRPRLSEGYTGEGEDPREPSHFSRMIKIYRELKAFQTKSKKKWSPSRPVAVDPTTEQEAGGNYISSKRSRLWADLFNLRYRILLYCIAHTFRLARVTPHNEPSARAVAMHQVFGEMYNLKTIARILVEMPLTDDPSDDRRAGPPFLLPKTYSLPASEADCWYLYVDMLKQTEGLTDEILRQEMEAPNRKYLRALLELDSQRLERVERILQGIGSMERYTR